MIYDYKSDEIVQDIILECYCPLISDIADEYSVLHRYENLSIYAPSYVAREIVSRMLEEIDDVWVHAESQNELLYNDDNEVVITIASDGMIFVETARCNNGQLKSNDDCSLTYMYDGFNKKDVDTLSANCESILVFGFKEDENKCNNDHRDCNEDGFTVNDAPVSKKEVDKKSVGTSTATYKVNGKECSKEDYEKALNEIDEKYLGSVQNMLLNYYDFVHEMNQCRRLLGWF